MAESADGARSVSLVRFVHISVVNFLFTISSTVMEPQKPRIIIYTPFNVSLNSRSLIWSFDCRRKISCLKNFSEQSNREKSEKKILTKFFKNDKLTSFTECYSKLITKSTSGLYFLTDVHKQSMTPCRHLFFKFFPPSDESRLFYRAPLTGI